MTTQTCITTTCPMCRELKYIMVDTMGYVNWCAGVVIQQALPDLSASDRESLTSGMCDDCFNLGADLLSVQAYNGDE